jgi:hypothetical protein
MIENHLLRLWSHILFGVEALPLVHSFALSDVESARAVFVRVYLDLIAERSAERPPQDWFDALQACLAKAGPRERDLYLAELAKAYLERDASRVAQPMAKTSPAAVTGEDIDGIIRRGRLDELVALAANGRVRLRAEHVAALAPRARALAERGDRRLAEALLSREPLRLETAPLFLEANAEQRLAILVAARRAELGRRPPPVPRLDEETAAKLEYAGLAGTLSEFVEALAEALGAEMALAGRIANDSSGEPLAVALIALGLARDAAVRIMTARDMQDGEVFPRVHMLARLGDLLPAPAARRILAALISPSRAGETPPIAASAPREAANPSPLARRLAARPGRDSGAHQPRNDSTVGAK